MLPPLILYKYLSAGRLDLLTNRRVRFTQRKFFEDDHELQPDYATFGTVEEIERHIRRTPSGLIPGITPEQNARLIASNPQYQQMAKETAIKNIKSLDQMGILCLTETANSGQMWNDYAEGGRGFVIALDTTHTGFRKLTGPLGIRKVSYSDEGFATFLGMMERSVFEPLYLKRMKYSFEREWRSIRLLKDLEPFAVDIFLSPLDPAFIREIIIRVECGVEAELRKLIASDERYEHVQIVKTQ